MALLLNSYSSLVFQVSTQVISGIFRCSVKNQLSFSKFYVCNLHVEETQLVSQKFSLVWCTVCVSSFLYMYVLAMCNVAAIEHLQISGFIKSKRENDPVNISSSGV